MSNKIIPLNARDRAIGDVVKELVAKLQNTDPSLIQSVYVRVVTSTKEAPEDRNIEAFHANLYWDDIAMLETEIEIMRHQYYAECTGNDE